ncbi:SpoIIE family protein phosphatase [Myxococcota bacterium]
MMMDVRWWSAQRPARGEEVCGDAVVVVEDAGKILVAVADGLGHGPRAAAAAEGFCGAVQRHGSLALSELMQRGAEAVVGTRGAVAALMSIDIRNGEGSFLGVGNIDVRALAQPPISVVSRPGIVGRRLPVQAQQQFRVEVGAIIALFSDGVSGRLQLRDYMALPTAEWPERILEKHGKGEDDATCIVLRVGENGRGVGRAPGLV